MVATILPLVLLVLGLGLDLTLWSRSTAQLQSAADAAALQAAHYLPHVSSAQQVAQLVFRERVGTVVTPQISVESAAVSIRVDARLKTTLASLVAPGRTIDATVVSRAQITPTNIDIVIDSSSYLAPPILDGVQSVADPATNRWGDGPSGVGQWRAAKIFNDDPLQASWSSAPSARIAPILSTQQCFNPEFSAIKEAAIRLYDHYGSIALNSVGVAFMPGAYDDPASNVREVLGSVRAVLPDGNRSYANGVASFPYQRSTYSSDEECLAIAEREETLLGYRFPSRAATLPAALTATISRTTRVGGRWRLPAQYAHEYGVRQVIWARSVARRYPSGTSQLEVNGDLPAAMLESGRRLLAAPHRTELRGARHSVPLLSIFLLGDFARSGSRRYYRGCRSDTPSCAPLLDRIQDNLDTLYNQVAPGTTLHFYLVTVRNRGVYLGVGCPAIGDDGVPEECPAFYNDAEGFAERVKEINDFLRRGGREERVVVHSVRVPDAGSMAEDLIAHLPLAHRSVSLTR